MRFLAILFCYCNLPYVNFGLFYFSTKKSHKFLKKQTFKDVFEKRSNEILNYEIRISQELPLYIFVLGFNSKSLDP